jgi:hypothetical protein
MLDASSFQLWGLMQYSFRIELTTALVNGEHDAGEDMMDWQVVVRSQFMERPRRVLWVSLARINQNGMT